MSASKKNQPKMGRPQNLLMLERLFDHIQGHDGVEFAFMKDVAADFARRFPRERG